MSRTTTEKYQIQQIDDVVCVQLIGNWRFQDNLPESQQIISEIDSVAPQAISFDCQQLGQWDSGLMIFLLHLIEHCKNNQTKLSASTKE